jgi:hypothetical protein
MTLTDRVTIAIEVWNDGTKLDGGDDALNALIASIPVAGGPIGSILFGRAQRQMRERAADVFEAFKERIEEIDKDKLNADFFESDEFATLLTLMLQQIQTTHDRQKLKMLATGLANSATPAFASEARKELFFRIIRDLAPEDVQALKGLVFIPGMGGLPASNDDHAVTLQRLVAQGLVLEDLQSEELPNFNINHPGNQILLKSAFEKPPIKRYSPSAFGLEFLRFFESETSGAGDSDHNEPDQ